MALAVPEDRQMDIEEWQGLMVRTREGHVVGRVVGVFAEGLLAGRLRVHGNNALGRYPVGSRAGMAVYAIPRQAVVCRLHDSLVLDTTRSVARSRWLMHVTLKKGA